MIETLKIVNIEDAVEKMKIISEVKKIIVITCGHGDEGYNIMANGAWSFYTPGKKKLTILENAKRFAGEYGNVISIEKELVQGVTCIEYKYTINVI